MYPSARKLFPHTVNPLTFSVELMELWYMSFVSFYVPKLIYQITNSTYVDLLQFSSIKPTLQYDFQLADANIFIHFKHGFLRYFLIFSGSVKNDYKNFPQVSTISSAQRYQVIKCMFLIKLKNK